jgi:5-formyltetrahydrofolate cyclo-ligase
MDAAAEGRTALTGAALLEAKRSLRRQVLLWRDGLDAAWREHASRVIFERVARLAPVRGAGRMLAYHSFGSETVTVPFLRQVLAEGRRLVLPRIDRPARSLTLHEVHDLDADLVSGPWGIREPDPGRTRDVDPADLDVVLVPGVAFDRTGGRLGYGGGYYDRLLGACAPGTVLVAAAFEGQVVERVPVGPQDRSVDVVVTEEGVHRRGAASASW